MLSIAQVTVLNIVHFAYNIRCSICKELHIVLHAECHWLNKRILVETILIIDTALIVPMKTENFVKAIMYVEASVHSGLLVVRQMIPLASYGLTT